MNLRTLSFFVISFVFLILLYCCSPSVNSGDSGEFITTSCILGIAHSPGYPLYSLLGKVFGLIIPFGNYAFRINLMNVIITYVLLIVIFFWGKQNLNSLIKEFVAVLVSANLVFSTSFFRNSVQTEVFVLNVLFAVIILMCMFSAERNPKLIYLITFIFGLSSGNHHTIVFLIPSFLYLLYSLGINIRKLLLCIVFFLIGFSIYLYLPIRAFKEPYFNWGDPKNLVRIYRVITRKDYGTFQLTVEKPLESNIPNYYKQIKRFIESTVDNLTIVLMLFGILAFYLLFKNNKKLFWMLFLSYLMSGVGFFLLANLPFEPIYDGILERFYILPNTVLIITIIFALRYISKDSVIKLALGLSFVSLLYNFYKNFNSCNYRWYLLNYDYGMNILRTLPHNSILFMDGGDDTFYTLGYLQAVEKRRTDVSLHDRGGLVFKNIYGIDFRKLTREEKEERRQLIESSFAKQRPVFYSTFNKKILPNYNLKYAGVLYAVENDFLPKGFTEKIWKEIYSLRSVYQNYYDYRSKALVPIYYFMEAVNSENTDFCVQLLKYAYTKWKEVDWLKNNIIAELHFRGYSEFQRNNFELCEKIYSFLLKINPEDKNALLNLGAVYEKLEKLNEAEILYKRVLELDAVNVTAYYNLGVLYWKKSDWDNVIKCFRQVLKFQPENKQVMLYLERALLEKEKISGK